MKITVPPRECCQPKMDDLKVYVGPPVPKHGQYETQQPTRFCIHCGAWWVWEKARTTDPADSGEWRRWTP